MNTLSEKFHSKVLVLVVDDEESICKTLCSILNDEDFDTVSANDGETALKLCAELKPAVCFLDIWMPGLDGIETLSKLKEISPETEVIMISGHATISNALDATKRGAFDFVEKPLNLESVIRVANRALEKRNDSVLNLSSSRESRGSSLLDHKGMLSTGLKGKNIGQRTLKQSAILYGHCLHSGQKSGLILEPLPLNSGIHFDKIAEASPVPAFVDYVESTSFATTLRHGTTVAATIEHLLAALHSYQISNLLIKCNGEVPIFDGSALEFCKTIDSIGIDEQGGEWHEIVVDKEISFKDDSSGEHLSISPSKDLKISYELNYPEPVGAQAYDFHYTGVDSFKSEIAPCRTFGFMKDIERLQKAGLAAGGRLDNFILIGNDKVVNTELRFPEELARHKILDVLGDLFLLGRPLRGHVKAKMTGHSDNLELARKIAPYLF